VYSIPSPIGVRDFTGRGRQSVILECEAESYAAGQELSKLVNDHEYTLQNNNRTGAEGAIEALQKSMSFTIEGKVPATTEQLRVMLWTARSQFFGNTMPEILSMVLAQYEVQSGIKLQLAIVSQRPLDRSYNVCLHRSFNQRVPTLWLYHYSSAEDESNDQWAAIIPHLRGNGGSYAAAVRARPPAPVVLQAHIVDPSMLHPNSAALMDVNNPFTAAQLTNSFRASSARSGRQVGSTKNPRGRRPHPHSRRPSIHASRAPSLTRIPEVDQHHKAHKCNQCDSSFMYPKDLRRHVTKHSKSKEFPCRHCSKSFTRDDNMKRHVRNDHSDRNAPAIGGASSYRR
jgi:hypothetical protein